MKKLSRVLYATPLLLLSCNPAPVQEPATSGLNTELENMVVGQKWTGDLDGMIERRWIRALVVPSKTHYFVERGQQRGLAYEALKAFEDEINRRRKTHLRVNVVFVPVSRAQLQEALLEGRGDLIAAGITVTAERRKVVDFSIPTTTKGIDQIVVTGPKAPKLTSLADLSGQEVFVRKGSIYWDRLEILNRRLADRGQPPVRLREAPEDLEDEDVLEMLNAGLVNITVVNDYIANVWAKVLTGITPRPDLTVASDDALAWVFRPNSPRLKAAVDGFLKTHRQGTTFGNTLVARYTGDSQFVRDSTSPTELKKYQTMVKLFQKYGAQYDVDYLLLMAQGYQESRLDQGTKSRVGALGVMQVMPATGKEMQVGDVRQLEPNIHAGVKYIRFMVDRYYADEPMTRINKGLFAFASYNAGPTRVRQLREEAKRRGFDPNIWFNHVEVIAAERIGAETVTYVSNIYKYYVAYKLVAEDQERDRARGAQPG